MKRNPWFRPARGAIGFDKANHYLPPVKPLSLVKPPAPIGTAPYSNEDQPVGPTRDLRQL